MSKRFTEEEVAALTAMIWGAPCAGSDLHFAKAIVRAMELLREDERPRDPASGGRLLPVPEEML